MAEDQHDDYCLREYKHLFKEDLLRGQVAFITGGASGIGFRIAELFMRHGCNVVIGSRRMEKLQQVNSNATRLKTGRGGASGLPDQQNNFARWQFWGNFGGAM